MMEQPCTIQLRQIAAWGIDGLEVNAHEVKASVPALQRGLVWGHQQVEMLWDSILRGFPIGALVVCEQFAKQEITDKLHVTHHLLDGQQRSHSIALGFHDPFSNQSLTVKDRSVQSILWLDLAPKLPQDSVREYLVRVSTTAHPWGFQSDNDANVLRYHQRRASLARMGLVNERPSPSEHRPYISNCPVPMAWAFDAALELGSGDIDLWITRLCDKVQMHRDILWPESPDCDTCSRTPLELLETCEWKPDRLFKAINRAGATKLVLLEAPSNLTDSSQQEAIYTKKNWDLDGVSHIEQLFQRLNKQGTPLDGEELNYSMIKAYWPEVVAVVDGIKRCRVPASRVVSLGVRLALSSLEKGNLQRAVATSTLRLIATNPDDPRHAVLKAYFLDANSSGKPRLVECIEIVEVWLGQIPATPLPPVIISSIARDSQDVYLLLLHYAECIGSKPTDEQLAFIKCLPGLATLIHGFGRRAKEKQAIVDHLYVVTKEKLTVGALRGGISEAIREGWLIEPREPSILDEFIELWDDLTEWNWGMMLKRKSFDEDPVRDNWWSFLDIFRHRGFMQELLLFAQSDLMKSAFSDYDPAQKELWKNHNRPWDIDHISPSKFYQNRKDGADFFEFCKEWYNTVGNLRAWPAVDNRSDQDASPQEKIAEPELRIQSFILPGECGTQELDALSQGDKTRKLEPEARQFAECVKARLIRIYGNWYDNLSIADLATPSFSDLK